MPLYLAWPAPTDISRVYALLGSKTVSGVGQEPKKAAESSYIRTPTYTEAGSRIAPHILQEFMF
jgi:hypothetical protein